MIVQRLFSHTWENLKDPGERTKKANELKEKRQIINARRDKIIEERNKGLEDSALGKNLKFVKDKAGNKIKDKDGRIWTEPVTAEEVDSRFKAQMKDLNRYTDSILDKKHRTPKPKPKPEPVSGLKKTGEYIKNKGSEILKKPGTKKLGYLGAGALGGTLAVSGVDKLVEKRKEKKKENEARKQILGKK